MFPDASSIRPVDPPGPVPGRRHPPRPAAPTARRWGFWIAGFALLCAGGTAQATTPDACAAALPARLTGQLDLPGDCVYARGIAITDSGTTLDCHGAVFDGQGRLAIGLSIDSQGRPLSNVTVRQCTFRNFENNGVRVGWREQDTHKGDDHETIYRNTPQGVVLDALRVEASGHVGVYFDDYVTRVTLTHSVVQDSAGVGLYLEHSSARNRITSNRFAHNGDSSARREALAIDSSAGNVIEDNSFENNLAGGIFLYKNCGEHADGGRSVTRWQSSDGNVIRGNRFLGERVGVWIASRQSRNLQKTGCSDAPMDPQGRFFEDHADANTVERNTFCGTGVAVRVEGDRNRITDNLFDPRLAASVELPKTMRERLLGRAPQGNVVTPNRSAPCPR